MKPDRGLPCFAQLVERHPRESHEEFLVGGDLAAHDATGHRERELHELSLGLLQERLTKRCELLECFAQTSHHRIAATVSCLDACPFALGVALRERIAL